MDALASQLVRVFLLIENRLLREALVHLFRKRPDLLVVGQSGQADITCRDILESKCDVLVIASFETRPPAGFVLDCIRQFGCKVILIGMDPDEEQFLQTVRAGVTGYLLKDASASDVVAAVRAVFRGEAVCPPPLCLTLFRFVVQASKDAPPHSPATSRPGLTLRQQQLAALVAKGLTNKEIAAQLNLSEYTVRNHIHRILKQVDADSRRQAVDVIRASGYMLGSA